MAQIIIKTYNLVMQYPIMFATIFGLAVAAGIKDMLFSTGFSSVDLLVKTQPAELAAILGIDIYVARLIYLAAKKHMQMQDLQYEINHDEKMYAARKNRDK